MKYLLLILLLLLTSCADYFPIDAKMEEMRQLNCKPPHNTLCAGWKV